MLNATLRAAQAVPAPEGSVRSVQMVLAETCYHSSRPPGAHGGLRAQKTARTDGCTEFFATSSENSEEEAVPQAAAQLVEAEVFPACLGARDVDFPQIWPRIGEVIVASCQSRGAGR